MTGFKEGAASSGLDEDDEDDKGVEGERQAQSGQPQPDVEPREETVTESSSSGGAGGLPWIYERSGITDGRKKTVQLHLQQTTLEEERDAKASLESMLGETVNKADIREAAYLIGLSQLDDVAEQLREWGYDAE